MKTRLFAAATAILLIAFALRTVGITSAPPGLSGDEGINGSDALNVWRWGTKPVFFTNNYGREAGFIYMMALSIRLIGANVLGIRLPAIACGTAGVLLSFILLHRLWNLRVAAVATALMGVSLWPIFVSRVGLRAVSMLPFQALSAYALWRGIHTREPRASFKWSLVLGASLGLVTYTYIPGRIFPAVLVGWLLSMVLLTPARWRPPISRHLLELALALVVAVAIFLPFGLFIVQNPDQANQRVQELSGILDSLTAGDLRPLLQTTVRTLGMFTFVGDQYWRYNIAYRPVFDWVTGLLFYGGVILCLAHIRRPRHQLLLLWLGLMLTPSILAPGSPSFLRATGAIIPVYAMPAIALDTLAAWIVKQRVHHRWARPERWLPIVIAAGLLAVGVKDGFAYFVTWPNTPRVREVYTAGLAQVGRQLSQLTGEDPTVLVGCDFASDYARDMVRFQTAYTGPIRWFTGRSAMVFPASAAGEGHAYYLIADALPPEALIAPITSRAETLYVATSIDGAFESAGYRLPAESRMRAPWQPQTPLTGRFQGAMSLVGYTAPEEAERGGSASFLVIWEVPPTYEVDRSEALWFHLELKDEMGNAWDTRANLLPYANWEWHPGDTVAQWLTVPIAPEVPPGPLVLEFAIEKAQAPLPYLVPGEPDADAVALGPISIVGTPASEVPEEAVRLGAGQEIALVEALIIGVALPGDTIHATLTWQPTETPQRDYAARLLIREADCAGAPVHSEALPLWPDRYPTSRWQPGERVRSFHHPQLPRDLTVGTYAIAIDLLPVTGDAEDSPVSAAQACYPLEIVGHRREFQVPPMDNRVDQAFTDGVRLLGYSLSPPVEEVGPGDTLEITLIWQATGEPSQSYTVFTHLYDPSGNLIAQHDSLPCDGDCPTSSWVPEEVISDLHTLALPNDAEAGAYTLGVGMYNGETLDRLDIPDNVDDVITVPGPSLP
ncbi:MAG: glycosyltransferase family 39 protein [Anaerolineae bacterium]|nr:glycosyltransferase family 39 protein [Anaerolineae bacterium]